MVFDQEGLWVLKILFWRAWKNSFANG
jgi:hypothetical protein